MNFVQPFRQAENVADINTTEIINMLIITLQRLGLTFTISPFPHSLGFGHIIYI